MALFDTGAALVSLFGELDGKPSLPGTIRLASLAWLIERGLRRTACCMDTLALPAVRDIFGDRLRFETRGLRFETPGPGPGGKILLGGDAPLDKYALGDNVVIYAAGARSELAPVWDEQRRTLTAGLDLGRSLGYLMPVSSLVELGEAGWVFIQHFATHRGCRVGLWSEAVGKPPDLDKISGHVAPIRDALSELGLSHEYALCKESLDLTM